VKNVTKNKPISFHALSFTRNITSSTSIKPNAALTMIAPIVTIGKSVNVGNKRVMVNKIMVQDTSPEIGDLAPALSLIEERGRLPKAGNIPKKDPIVLQNPKATNSLLEDTL